MQLRLSLERELAMGRRIHTRFVAGLGLILVLWSGNTGCITQRKSFSLDSNSRVPFFGLELAPNDRSTQNEIRSITHSQTATRSWNDPFGKELKKRLSAPRIPFPRTDKESSVPVDLEKDVSDQF
ncbi:hypothetical protein [Planctopirus ephydatiae]|jgi:hypothetical protein|nr:hypothetical protein [Planctopirus ephydatiae]